MSSKFDNNRDLIIGYCALAVQIKELEEKKKELEREVKPILADEGLQVFDEFTIEVKTVEGRKTLDRKALEATYGDLSDFMKIGAPSMRATVKKVGK